MKQEKGTLFCLCRLLPSALGTASRTWVCGVVACYSYARSGELLAINYSKDTSDVSHIYDRFGHLTSAITAGISTNLYAYSFQDPLTNDTVSLCTPVRSHHPRHRCPLPPNFSYSYLPDSNLLSGIIATHTYEPHRPLITAVENRFSETVISRYDNTNDQLGRRTAISRSGIAFGDTPVQDSYGCNHRSEVTSARRFLANNPAQEIRGFSYDYAYDLIGNRTTSTTYDPDNNALTSTYTANQLNQYETCTVPGYAAVLGTASNDAVVTVNGNPAWRLNDYFYGGDEADNATSVIYKELTVIAAHSNQYTADTSHVFLAQSPEMFTYDTDGNQKQNGRFTRTWDGENRLIAATTRDDLPANVPRTRVTYTYDHQSRRIASTTAIYTNDTWQVTESRTFLYDGWNVIAEVVCPVSGVLTTNYYVWELDLSGSLQGAGGIGGLLAANLNGTNVFYSYDANGNVTELTDDDGTIHAHYEYSPFGETIVASGLLAKFNPFRFSTKWFDNATGLGYWGYRWYSPNMGRWLNRDLADEGGGANLYCYVINSPIDERDILGLACSWAVGKCTRTLLIPACPKFIFVNGIPIPVPSMIQQEINSITMLHHDDTKAVACKGKCFLGMCIGGIESVLVRGFFAKSISEAVREKVLDIIGKSTSNGWVEGEVRNSKETAGPCALKCVAEERYNTVIQRMETLTPTRYKLTDYTCQSYALEIIAP